MINISSKPTKIAITGASGFIGRQLIPRLRDTGCKLLLIGRDPASLKCRFPDIECCGYDALREQAQSYDLLVHLAVLNNDADASPEDFERVNVKFLSEILSQASLANISRFVNVTTFHALADGTSAYAESKRKALDLLKEVDDFQVLNLFLPAVYGDEFAGKLRLIERLPHFMRDFFLLFLSAMVPTVHIDRVVGFIKDGAKSPDRDHFLANPQDENIVFRSGKFFLDLSFVVGVLGIFWWLLLIVWILIPIESTGPGVFAQRRIGKSGKEFTIYKFRTMRSGTRQAGTHEMTADSITRFGAFLRKIKIDELLQVFNILIGNLSLVGPRPSLPVQTQLMEERKKRGVYSVNPGITGLAQVNDVDMSDPIKLARWDAQYIAQRSLPSEFKIVAKTFLGRGTGDRVKR